MFLLIAIPQEILLPKIYYISFYVLMFSEEPQITVTSKGFFGPQEPVFVSLGMMPTLRMNDHITLNVCRNISPILRKSHTI